ncbi:MAG: response regulator transcription factor [Balneolaceae bacterium]|jgi:DNA-binding NarL/FixJ family response regulator
MEQIKILLADDHKIIRDGIKSMLDGKNDFKIVAEADNGKKVLELCRSVPVDLIIMDINMPELNGIELTKLVKEQFPDIQVLTLTMMNQDKHIRQMIKVGASGYILKSSGSEELEKAIRTIMKGEHYFSKDATKVIMKDLVESGGKHKSLGSEELTDRELEILGLICQELTNKEIADKLFISVRTVDAHRRNLLQKTGARNTAGLVKYALQNNLILK